MVSLFMPQVVPANALRILLFLLTFASMLVACAVKYKRLSKVTARIFGYMSVGMVLLSTLTFNIFFTTLVQVVKRETDDLGADMRRFLLRKKFHQGRKVAGDI